MKNLRITAAAIALTFTCSIVFAGNHKAGDQQKDNGLNIKKTVIVTDTIPGKKKTPKTPSPTPTPTPTDPNPSPTPTPTPTPSPTPYPNPTPTPTPSPNPTPTPMPNPSPTPSPTPTRPGN
jgi:outer membrane biosynthesis protein TonB